MRALWHRAQAAVAAGRAFQFCMACMESDECWVWSELPPNSFTLGCLPSDIWLALHQKVCGWDDSLDMRKQSAPASESNDTAQCHPHAAHGKADAKQWACCSCLIARVPGTYASHHTSDATTLAKAQCGCLLCSSSCSCTGVIRHKQHCLAHANIVCLCPLSLPTQSAASMDIPRLSWLHVHRVIV